MKKIYLNIILATIVTMGVVSCSSDTLFMDGSNQVKANEVVASVEGQSSTRVAIVDAATKSMIWTSGDQIAVYDETGASGTLDLNDNSANQSWGTFGGELDANFGTMVSAAYPSTGTSLNGTTLSMSIPAVISLADAVTVEGSKAYKFPLPMFGRFDNNNVEFKFLTGMLKLVIGNLPAKTEKVIITADKQISGTFTASTEAATPVLASTSNESSDKVITVTFNALEEAGAKVIYIPLAVQNYGNIAVQYAGKFDGSTVETRDLVNWTNKDVARKYVYTAAYGYTIEVDATSPSAVSEAIGGTIASAVAGVPVNVILTGTVTTSAENTDILIPTVNSDDEPIDVNLTFGNLPSEAGGTLGIKTDQAGSGSTVATNKLSITFPSTDTGINLNIDAPTSTVTLQSESGAIKFKEISARTAFNTLVVDDDVTVNNVDIEDGVVQINNGGVLDSWTFAAETNGDQVSIHEDGGIVPFMIPTIDENGYLVETCQVIKENGDPYYARSLKIAKGEADYSIVWFGQASFTEIPLETVIVGDNAVLQTTRVEMKHVAGEGERTARIKYRFEYQPTSNWDEADWGGEGKFYEYSPDMSGLKTLKNIIFSQPEIAPNEGTQPIIQNLIDNNYKLWEPTLKLDVEEVIEDCTFEYNGVYICHTQTLNCPVVKNCKFVHVDNRAELSQYNVASNEYDKIDFHIPMVYDGSITQNSFTFENCEFSPGTKLNASFYVGAPGLEPWSNVNYVEIDGKMEQNQPEYWYDGNIHYTGHIYFNGCKLGGTDFKDLSTSFIGQFAATSGTKMIIYIDNVPKYQVVYDGSPEVSDFVVSEYVP